VHRDRPRGRGQGSHGPVGHRAGVAEVRVAELVAQRLEGGHLVRAEAADAFGEFGRRDERRRLGLGVELVRVHDDGLLAGLRHVVAGRKRKALADHLVAADADAGVVRGEPAQPLREPFLRQQLVAQHPVPDVVRVIQHAGIVIQLVHPDVVQQGAGPHQVAVGIVGPRQELLGYHAHDPAVAVDDLEGGGRRGMPAVEGEDFRVGRDPHGLEPSRRGWGDAGTRVR